MRKRIFRAICGVALASLLLMCVGGVTLVHRQAELNSWAALSAKASYIAVGIEEGGERYLERMRQFADRVTLIAADGTVLFDDRSNAAEMDNHLGRPEVAEALQSGSATAQRQSETLGERTLYYAQRLNDGTVLRVADNVDGVLGGMVRMLPLLVVTVVLIVIAAALVARLLTRRLLAPLERIDPDAPAQADAYEELAPLLRRLAEQRRQIDEQLKAQRHQQEVFGAVSGSMHEGLVLLDAGGQVLTINPSARQILGVPAGAEAPGPLLAFSRNLKLEAAARQALAGRHVEEVLEQDGGRLYRLLASPARQGSGAVLLLMDDSDRLAAEQQRREFSANVSHELKTPLTSISGYAELLKDGLVAPEDTAEFAGRIHGEAQRLVALVEDIIKLSRLDEKHPVEPDFERVDLMQLARQTTAVLADVARKKQVKLLVEGDELNPVEVRGVRSILGEVLYNLVDNAIRYNRPGGQVVVTVEAAGHSGGARLAVSDTGIGIPPAHRQRIFERFYRVDTSHSRRSGGTGLGLAIVKRGVLYHNGSVEVGQSEGGGAVFTVELPQ